MKKYCGSLVRCLLVLALSLVCDGKAQISIKAENLPTDVGTLIITKNNTTDSIVVDVGSAGENQHWRLDEDFPNELHRQLIIAPTASPYHAFFPESDVVTRYTGNLGNFMDSYYFENTVGTFYLYEKKTPEHFLLQGIGFDSTTVNFGAFRFTASGYFEVQPIYPLFDFPLEYNKSWHAVSNFTMQIDTLLGEDRVLLVADVRDSVHNIVDGWGQIVLPTRTYECLRVKSDMMLNEKLFLNGLQIRSKMNRSINYYWLNQENGIVAKVSSFLNPTDDNIKLAKRIYRLHMLNPQINIAVADTVAQPGDVIDIPIYISNPVDLNIRKISMCINCDTSLIEPVGVRTMSCLAEKWNDPCVEFSNNTYTIELSGDAPLAEDGVLCKLCVKVLPLFDSDTTTICIGSVYVDEAGPHLAWQSGRLIINGTPSTAGEHPVNVPMSSTLYANFPNPFNSGTTLEFQLEKDAHVRLRIYNSMGQLVSVLAEGFFERGFYTQTWQGVDREKRQLPSGIYFYQIDAIDPYEQNLIFTFTRKMMLLR